MGSFLCTRCHARYREAGECRACDGEPLMDLDNPDIRLMLQEEDERNASARHQRFLMGFALVGFLLSLPLFFWVASIGGTLRQLILCLTPVAVAEAIGESLYRWFPSRKLLPDD